MTSSNAKVDAFIEAAEGWQGEIRRLRALLLDCGLGEELKWGKPCYTAHGGNVAIIQPFKAHCALMFFKGALLDDSRGVLVRPGKNSRAARRVEFTSEAQIQELEPVLRTHIERAVEIEAAGLRVEKGTKPALELPEELQEKLKGDEGLARAFHALTPGRQRAYVLHFSGAKQSKTRRARVERCVEKILAGKGLNDR